MNEQQKHNNKPDNINSTHPNGSTGRYKPYRKVNPAYLAKIKQLQQGKHRVNPGTESIAQPNIQSKPVTRPMPKAIKGSSDKRTLSSAKIPIAISIGLILVVLAGVAVYSYSLYSGAKSKTNITSTGEAQQAINTAQAEETLRELRKIVVLPTDEEPVMAIIMDIDQLKTAKFYKDAKNGDRVIFYNKSQKAYIYRPENKTVINFVSFQSNELEQPVK